MSKEFMSELIALCKKHDALIFPRQTSKRVVVCVQMDDTWVDFMGICGTGAEGWNGVKQIV